MTYTAPTPHPVCGALSHLPGRLLPQALRLVAPHPDTDINDIERYLRCTLQAHHDGDHHAFVIELDGPDAKAVWTRWSGERLPAVLDVLPDCPSTEADSHEPCCEFAGHPGGHTYQLTTEPVEATEPTTWPAVTPSSP